MARSPVVTLTIRRGRTGPCSSTPSSATSFRTFHSSTSPSTSPTAVTIFSYVLMLKTLRQIASIGIVTEPPPQADESLRIRAGLQDRIRAVLGRALCIRHVDAGSCNGCELEIHALNNPMYNLEGLGIRFVASPRHADLLLVTGPVSKHMLRAHFVGTYEATPEPKLVVAVGDCGCTGGIFGEGYASCGRVSNVIPVDVAVPGCPPSPTRILEGILTAHHPPTAWINAVRAHRGLKQDVATGAASSTRRRPARPTMCVRNGSRCPHRRDRAARSGAWRLACWRGWARATSRP